MSGPDSYTTIVDASADVYTQMRSRFMAFAYPVDDEAQVGLMLKSLRKKYHDARHIPYAFRLGPAGQTWRASDDGEPSGTGGKPIYGAILSAELTDVLVAVVRYYGGTPLGAANLGRAYAQAARQALERAKVMTKEETKEFTVITTYPALDYVMRTVRASGGKTSIEYRDAEILIEISIGKSKAEDLKKTLTSQQGVKDFCP